MSEVKPVETPEDEIIATPTADVLTTEQLEQKIFRKQKGDTTGDKNNLDMVPGNRRKFL